MYASCNNTTKGKTRKENERSFSGSPLIPVVADLLTKYNLLPLLLSRNSRGHLIRSDLVRNRSL
jgi:hypothetical protein